jgi:hypothetical protein
MGEGSVLPGGRRTTGSVRVHEDSPALPGQGIDVLFRLPHSSDQTQQLDVLTLAVMKRHFSGSRFSRLENPQTTRLVRILGAWSESSAPHHSIEASLRFGPVPIEEPLRSGEYDLKVQREAARCLRRRPGLEEGRQGIVTAGGTEEGASPSW